MFGSGVLTLSCVCLTPGSVCRGYLFFCDASLERQGHLFGWEPGISDTPRGCLLLRDEQSRGMHG